MTKEKLMRALMISSSANLNYTKLLFAFPAYHFHSVETQNQNTKKNFWNRFNNLLHTCFEDCNGCKKSAGLEPEVEKKWL
ncbi:MAG: hypothetical protein HYS25_08290 [Ignavibacteriales bacterium]|nr:hypothetical protein [Ignavibacteriales bacterium]